MNTPESEIALAQEMVNEANTRLSHFFNYYWCCIPDADSAKQRAAHNAVKQAIDEAVAKMELLKETLK